MIVGEEGVVVGSFSGKSLLPTRLDLFLRRDFPFFEPPLDIPKRLDGVALRPQPQAVQVVIADRLETVWRSEPFVELLMTRGDERVFAFALAAEESEILDLRSEHGFFWGKSAFRNQNVAGGRTRTQGKSPVRRNPRIGREGGELTLTGRAGGQKKRWSIQARPLAVTIQPEGKVEDFWM